MQFAPGSHVVKAKPFLRLFTMRLSKHPKCGGIFPRTIAHAMAVKAVEEGWEWDDSGEPETLLIIKPTDDYRRGDMPSWVAAPAKDWMSWLCKPGAFTICAPVRKRVH